jgi:hypothetical protein
MKTDSQRRHDLDWLRVLGVLLLVPFHAAQIFILDPISIMYVKDTVNSRSLTYLAGFLHMWHMPMLFVISGSATYFALGFRSARGYIRERLQRLFVPFIFGILTYIPLTTYIQHSQTISLPEAYLGFFQIDFAHLDGMTGTFTPAHLWFILYLFVFALIGLPIFSAMRSEKGRKLIGEVAKVLSPPLTLLLLAVPLALAAALNILGDKNPIYYFLMFFSGYLIASDARFQQAITKMVWGALAFGIFAAVIQMTTRQNYPEWSLAWIGRGLLSEMGRWTLTLAALGLGKRFFNRSNTFLRYANEAAMPFYLLHMTFTVWTGYYVVQINAPVLVKYPLIVLIATCSTFLAYELARHWKVTRWMLGMKISS